MMIVAKLNIFIIFFKMEQPSGLIVIAKDKIAVIKQNKF